MKKTLQVWSALVLFLFLFPFILNYLPEDSTAKTTNILKEPIVIVHAANILEDEIVEEEEIRTALLYFTHTNEAFEPVTKAVNGKVAVYHQTENITKFGEKLKNQLEFNDIQTDVLPINNQQEMNLKGIPYGLSYQAIRSHVKKQITEKEYDLIIDVHRDSATREATTLTHNGESYAKIAFVIGLEHPNFLINKTLANEFKKEMENLVPGITRDHFLKSGPGVDGKYNQDLHPSLLLIELGGVGNTEAELNRTVSVIGKAAAIVLENKKNEKY